VGTWGAGPALVALLTTFGVVIFTGIPALVIGEGTATAKVAGNAVSSLLQDAAFVAVPILILTLMVGPMRRRDFGVRMPARPLRIVALIVVAFFVYLLLSKLLGDLIGVGDQQDDLPDKLGAKESTLAGLVIAFCVTVVAPIGEEFLLRGVLFQGLRNSFSRVTPQWVAIGIAALIDGAIFGALHAGGTDAIFLPLLALFGIVLCLLFQFSGSLYASIVVHATNNTVAIASALGWSFLSGLVLWIGAIAVLSLIALGVRRFDARLPERLPFAAPVKAPAQEGA
jgi:membrane protease YdiL (CAAX protease family)